MGSEGRGETAEKTKEVRTIIEEYSHTCRDIPIDISVYRSTADYVPLYDLSIPSIGAHTELILEKIRQELVRSVHLGVMKFDNAKQQNEEIQSRFIEAIEKLIHKYFPASHPEDMKFMQSYLIVKSIGLGDVEILMSDPGLEEIAINGANEPVWVYHRRHGWLKTNVRIKDEEQIKYYATTIGRKVGRQISTLEPLLDVTINVGDRVNATLMPISNEGNTITIRKFSATPWTITDFLKHGTISYEAAALLWQAIQFEMSILIAGGTASGKTSMLNILSNFFAPNQRIISIEDTREIKLPSFLHWIPMLTRLANPEGKGGVSMLNLLQNSLRQRPDKILVGEIRRPAEAEVLFEAIHTGHSVYATVHANTAEETVQRLSNPPINVPKAMISALSLIVVQYRNRRSGQRRTFQIAEVTESGDANVLFQYDPNKDILQRKNQSKTFMKNIEIFSGISPADLERHLKEKEEVLRYLVKNNINGVEDVGHVMAEYYTTPKEFLAKAGLSKNPTNRAPKEKDHTPIKPRKRKK